jgi:hypothetical protein
MMMISLLPTMAMRLMATNPAQQSAFTSLATTERLGSHPLTADASAPTAPLTTDSASHAGATALALQNKAVLLRSGG